MLRFKLYSDNQGLLDQISKSEVKLADHLSTYIHSASRIQIYDFVNKEDFDKIIKMLANYTNVLVGIRIARLSYGIGHDKLQTIAFKDLKLNIEDIQKYVQETRNLMNDLKKYLLLYVR